MAFYADAQIRQTMTTQTRAALLHGIYAIVNDGENTIALTQAILAAGICIVQYRAKGGIVAQRAHALRKLTHEHGALFLLNDDWRAVQTYDADGAHVGPQDARFGELAQPRECLRDRILGVSCGTPQEARLAAQAGADYVGAGAVYATHSKADAGEPIGIAGLRSIAAATTTPVAAIGGITLERLPAVRASGVEMAAVISAIADAPDPRHAATALVQAWNA
jgi:thiamine-phosphate pyrophosphorylase